MSDLVERLRKRNEFVLNGGTWMLSTVSDADCKEAADEIERLRAEIEAERNSQISAVNNMLKAEQDNERLQSQLHRAECFLSNIRGMCNDVLARAALEGKGD
jgi:uncharacterized protein (DUF3084 family)